MNHPFDARFRAPGYDRQIFAYFALENPSDRKERKAEQRSKGRLGLPTSVAS